MGKESVKNNKINGMKFSEVISIYLEQNLTNLAPEYLIKFKAHRCNVGCGKRYINQNIAQLSISA